MPEECSRLAHECEPNACGRCRAPRERLLRIADWVHRTVFEPGSAILTWAVEFSGLVVSRFPKKCFGWEDSV